MRKNVLMPLISITPKNTLSRKSANSWGYRGKRCIPTSSNFPVAPSATRIPPESLLALRLRLASLAPRDPQRPEEVRRVAALFGVSTATVYRALRLLQNPKGLRRTDKGCPRIPSESEMAHYCEVIAAQKIRTENGQGHRLSTNRAIELLEEFGIDTPTTHVRVEKGLLKPTMVNRWLRSWGTTIHA